MIGGDQPVFRRRPLPVALAHGRLVVSEAVVDATGRSLRSSRGVDGPHEGLVYWAGWEVPGVTIIGFAITPEADHGWGHVRADEASVAASARVVRELGAGILAQVHSHPGIDTRHSDGDDDLVLMPFEGMFSVVVANYGQGLLEPRTGIGLHQFQDGRWIRIDPARGALTILATAVRV